MESLGTAFSHKGALCWLIAPYDVLSGRDIKVPFSHANLFVVLKQGTVAGPYPSLASNLVVSLCYNDYKE